VVAPPGEVREAQMTRREKIGLAVLVALFGLLGIMLLKSQGGTEHAAKDSYFVRQRIINLEKGE